MRRLDDLQRHALRSNNVPETECSHGRVQALCLRCVDNFPDDLTDAQLVAHERCQDEYERVCYRMLSGEITKSQYLELVKALALAASLEDIP